MLSKNIAHTVILTLCFMMLLGTIFLNAMRTVRIKNFDHITKKDAKELGISNYPRKLGRPVAVTIDNQTKKDFFVQLEDSPDKAKLCARETIKQIIDFDKITHQLGFFCINIIDASDDTIEMQVNVYRTSYPELRKTYFFSAESVTNYESESIKVSEIVEAKDKYGLHLELAGECLDQSKITAFHSGSDVQKNKQKISELPNAQKVPPLKIPQIPAEDSQLTKFKYDTLRRLKRTGSMILQRPTKTE